MSTPDLTRYAWLSIAAALATITLKLAAWKLTGSVGLLSDALESLVNLGGAVMALLMLRLAAQPPDAEHAYGHGKAEYFSGMFEGLLVLGAGAAILLTAIPRLLSPQPIEQAALGLAVSAVATAINFFVARVLLRAGREHRSTALQADAHHLMTDVWSSIGVFVGVVLVALTGWNILDPLLAIAVSLNVLWTARKLLQESAQGLMDSAWSVEDQQVLQQVLASFRSQGVDFHALRTRVAGRRRFVSLHALVPGAWTVQRAHDLIETIEIQLAEQLPGVSAVIHMEPIEDPASYADQELDRADRKTIAAHKNPPSAIADGG